MSPTISYKSYVHSIEIWQNSVKIPLKDQAMILINGLPQKTDRFGDLRALMVTNIGYDTLKSDTGVESLVKELDKLFKPNTFTSIVNWLKNFENLTQGNNSVEVFFQNARELNTQASEEFDFELPSQLLAAKLMIGCNTISPDQFASITSTINLGIKGQDGKVDANLHTKVEDAIRQYTTTTSALDKTKSGKVVSVKLTKEEKIQDLLANHTSEQESAQGSSSSDSEPDFSKLSKKELKVLLTKLKPRKSKAFLNPIEAQAL